MKIDKKFKPIYKEFAALQQTASKPLSIAVERNDGYTFVFNMKIDENSYRMAERIVKSILWTVGGFKVFVSDKDICTKLQAEYCMGGKREFDFVFMQKIYEKPFEICYASMENMPKAKECSIKSGGNQTGARIGFDAGGSDRKVCAVLDGKCLYSEEVLWLPKLNSDPDYHYQEIKTAFETAKSYLPRVDSIGVSSAGVYVNNQIKAASLFIKVNDEDFKSKVKNMYIDIANEVAPNAPLIVANDGDVSALCGAIELNDTNILGLAFGTSEAAGFIDGNGNLNGWLSELAFVPCDMSEEAMEDEWSGDIGCGVKYFSQDGVIKLAEMAGIQIDESLTLAKKLKFIQDLVEKGNEKALEIFEDIGEYLGHTIAYYSLFYSIKHLLIMGRVTSGKGGEALLAKAKEVLATYKHLSINLNMPDEANRRVGQAFAASTL